MGGRMGMAAALAVLLFAGSAMALPRLGEPAPDFKVTTFDGKVVTLKDLRGQVVVLNFWATWCGPCKRELPLLDAYYRVQQKHGLAVIAVTTEDSLPLNTLKPLAKQVSMPMAWQFRGHGYGNLEALPTNFVIDRSGVMRYAKAAAFSLDDLNSLLIPLLREPAPDDADPPAAPKTAAAATR